MCCRLCRNPLRASIGCDGCSPLKRLLHWPVDARLSADELAQDLAGLMRAQLTKLRRQLAESDEFNGRLVRELNNLAAQLVKLLTELRHSETLAARQVRQLDYASQATAILEEWFLYLPPEQQDDFRAQLEVHYYQQNKPRLIK